MHRGVVRNGNWGARKAAEICECAGSPPREGFRRNPPRNPGVGPHSKEPRRTLPRSPCGYHVLCIPPGSPFVLTLTRHPERVRQGGPQRTPDATSLGRSTVFHRWIGGYGWGRGVKIGAYTTIINLDITKKNIPERGRQTIKGPGTGD